MFRTVFLVCCFSLPTLGQEKEWATFRVETLLQNPKRHPSLLYRDAACPGRRIRFAFPRKHPSAENIGDICQKIIWRQTEPKDLYTAHSVHLYNQAKALKLMETSYTKCCDGDTMWIRLACATEKWKRSLEFFCLDDFATGEKLHHCCAVRDMMRYDCFNEAAPAWSYSG